MKYKIILFVVLFPALVSAQHIDTLAAEVLGAAMKSTLGISSDEVNMMEYEGFKELFDANAKVVDNMNVYYQFGVKGKPGYYKTDTALKPFDVYAHDVALQVKEILIDSFTILSSETGDKANMRYRVRRRVEVQKSAQYVIGDTKEYFDSRNIRFDPPADAAKMKDGFKGVLQKNMLTMYRFVFFDSLLVSIKYDDDSNACKITRIENISHHYNVDDTDNDGVLNNDDSLRAKAGDFTANGMPDYDLDGVPDIIDKCRFTYGSRENYGCPLSYFTTATELSGFVGMQMNIATIALPELNKLGYTDLSGNDAMDVLQSKKGVLKSSSGSLGVHAGINFTWYFGRKLKFGLSAGMNYSKFSAGYNMADPAVYTFRSFDGVDEYRRQVTIARLDEEIVYNVYNFPVMLNYRWHIGNTGGVQEKRGGSSINIKAGPSLMFFINRSDYDAVIDFGGIYQVDPATNTITYTNLLDPNSTYNVYITSAGINHQNTNPGAAAIFEQMSKYYDFASYKNFSGKSKKLTRSCISINMAVDFQKEITYKFAVKAGAHYVYAPLPEKSEKYKPIDKTTDVFSSIFNSSAKRHYSAYGFNMGFVYNF